MRFARRISLWASFARRKPIGKSPGTSFKMLAVGSKDFRPPLAFRRGPGPLLKAGGGRKSLLPTACLPGTAETSPLSWAILKCWRVAAKPPLSRGDLKMLAGGREVSAVPGAFKMLAVGSKALLSPELAGREVGRRAFLPTASLQNSLLKAGSGKKSPCPPRPSLQKRSGADCPRTWSEGGFHRNALIDFQCIPMGNRASQDEKLARRKNLRNELISSVKFSNWAKLLSCEPP
uniref:Uncharacterized protein n=1 Tax=Podarcis muralis TaxID=64176 RepID=A0A670HY40_PODMU